MAQIATDCWARLEASSAHGPRFDPAVPALQRVRRVTGGCLRDSWLGQPCAVVNASPMFAARHFGIRSAWKLLGAIDLGCVSQRWFVALLSQNAPSAKLSTLPYGLASRDYT